MVCTDYWRFVCREAKVEFGEQVASRLKLSKDGTKVLWPQPTDDPEDPQNVSFDRAVRAETQALIELRHSGRISARTSNCSSSRWPL